MKRFLKRVLPTRVVAVLRRLRGSLSVGARRRRIRELEAALRESEARVIRAEERRSAIDARLARAKEARDRARQQLAAQREVLDQWIDPRLRSGFASSPVVSLAYFPPGGNNPYMRLLYSRCAEVGVEPEALRVIDTVSGLDPRGLLHLHWLVRSQLGAASADQARQKIEAFLKPIMHFVERGGGLVTSIHEPLDKDVPFPQEEVEMRQRLQDAVVATHVMHASTLDETAQWYSIDPATAFTVPHPLYSGVYPRFIARGAARSRIGLSDGTVMLLCFGALKPYKGFDRVVAQLPRLREMSGRDVRLVIAGRTYRAAPPVLHDMIARAEAASHVTVIDSGVSDADVQLFFESADILALPYREMHNSGALMLGLTFGKVCVVPKTPITDDTLRTGLVHQFEMHSDEDLLRSLVEAVGRLDRVDPLPADFAEEYSPHRIAGQFAAEVARLVADRR